MNTAAIRRLRKNLALLQDIAGEETSVGQALVLLEVSLHPGEKITHLSDLIPNDNTYSSVSRAVDILGEHQGRNTRRVPAGLLERRDDPEDRRAKRLHLTTKGEKLISQLV